jgi:isoleucyl-tRNA synthetase
LYARLDDVDLARDIPVKKRPEIDRWAMALAHRTILTVTDALDRYDAKTAGEAIESFVDQLSNWYVRRNRRRFWKSTDHADKHMAYLTLYQCLDVAHRLMAPFVPFLAEHVYQNLVRNVDSSAPLSVHMADWPEENGDWRDDALLADVGVVQKVVSLGRSARNTSGVRTRQPLSRLLVRVPDDAAHAAVEAHSEQVLEELNVKALEFIARDAGLVSYRIKPNMPRLGKRGYGKEIPRLKQWLAEEADGAAIAGAVAMGRPYATPVIDEPLDPEDFLIETNAAEGYACAEDLGFLAALDTTLDDVLVDEGVARELVRSVQDARKQAGLDVSDRIVLGISGSADVERALATHRAYVMAETLANAWLVGQDAPLFESDRTLGETTWHLEFRRSV